MDTSRVLLMCVCGLYVFTPSPATAGLALPNLTTSASGLLFDSSQLVSGPSDSDSAAAGPVQSQIKAGLVLNYGPSHELESTLYANGQAWADYGSNGASVDLNFAATSGTDRGTFPVGNFSGSLPFNSSVEPQASASSSWRDTFIMTGGSGLGTASITVTLHGHAASGYGANGTLWYNTEPSFELFGTNGRGSAQYGLDIEYAAIPAGAPPEYAQGEYSQPIRWEQNYTSPLPTSINEIGFQDEVLTGTFLFEYGVPFELKSTLSISGYNQINVDFSHTAAVTTILIPQGADLNSYSNHAYPVSNVPEPMTVGLIATGLLCLLSRERLSGGVGG